MPYYMVEWLFWSSQKRLFIYYRCGHVSIQYCFVTSIAFCTYAHGLIQFKMTGASAYYWTNRRPKNSLNINTSSWSISPGEFVDRALFAGVMSRVRILLPSCPLANLTLCVWNYVWFVSSGGHCEMMPHQFNVNTVLSSARYDVMSERDLRLCCWLANT